MSMTNRTQIILAIIAAVILAAAIAFTVYRVSHPEHGRLVAADAQALLWQYV